MRKLFSFIVLSLTVVGIACSAQAPTAPAEPVAQVEEGDGVTMQEGTCGMPPDGEWNCQIDTVNQTGPHNFDLSGHYYRDYRIPVTSYVRTSEMNTGWPSYTPTWAVVPKCWLYTAYWTGSTHPFYFQYEVRRNSDAQVMCSRYITLAN